MRCDDLFGVEHAQGDHGHQCLVLWPLRSRQRPVVTSEHCEVLSSSVVLQHESARPYTACVIDNYGCSFYLCPSSSICACYFHNCYIFGLPKETLGGTASLSNEEVRFQCMNGCTYSRGFFPPLRNPGVNLLKPAGYLMHQQVFCVFCPHCMCFVCIWEQAVTVPLTL
jgi:hypothetical protein